LEGSEAYNPSEVVLSPGRDRLEVVGQNEPYLEAEEATSNEEGGDFREPPLAEPDAEPDKLEV
jgi:hypothetical protein